MLQLVFFPLAILAPGPIMKYRVYPLRAWIKLSPGVYSTECIRYLGLRHSCYAIGLATKVAAKQIIKPRLDARPGTRRRSCAGVPPRDATRDRMFRRIVYTRCAPENTRIVMII